MNRILFFLILILTCSNPFDLFSQGAGSAKIKGKVTDAISGEALPGATIVIAGTSLGTAANVDGEFLISNLKPGTYTLNFRYLGYKNFDTLNVQLKPGETLELNTFLHAESKNLEEVIVSIQVKGQRAAINQMRSSNSITNIVSSDKIRDVPDVNAAESIGRLPGVAIQRSGGEGNRVVVRGLSPKFTIVEIDGVRLSGVDDDRGVGLSSISSESLGSIELSKSLSADKDADAIGGIVNLKTKTADKGFHVDVTSTGGYNSLDDKFKNYKLSGSIGNRFFKDRLGVLVNAGKEQVIRSSDKFDAGYSSQIRKDANGDTVVDFVKNNVSLNEVKLLRTRQNAGIVLDFKNDFMKIKFNNVINQLNDEEVEHRDYYDFGAARFEANLQKNLPKEIGQTNSINSEFNILSTLLNVDLSYSKSTLNRTQDNYHFYNPEIFKIAYNDRTSDSLMPGDIIDKYFADPAKVEKSVLLNNDRQELTREDITKRAAIDWKVPYSLFSGDVSGNIKLGVKYAKKLRNSNTEQRSTSYDWGGIGMKIRKEVYEQYFPEFDNGTSDGLAQDYGVAAKNFVDPNYKPHDILNGRYKTGWSADYDLCRNFIDSIHRAHTRLGNYDEINPVNGVESNRNDYENEEELKAGYIMAEINIGKRIKLIPGLRIEDERTSYSSFYVKQYDFDPRGVAAGYPKPITTKRHNNNLFPSVNAKYDLTNWMSFRGAYYKSASRPDYKLLSPSMVANGALTTIDMYNPFLEPAIAHNYDLGVSFYSNKLGLLSVNVFYKKILNSIYRLPNYKTNFYNQAQDAPETIIQALKTPYSLYDTTLFPVKGGEDVRDGMPVNLADPAYLKGIEVDWQTNFWFLPGILKGIVLDLNGSMISSESKLPYFEVVSVKKPNGIGTIQKVYYKTRDSRLIDQPGFMFNTRLGFDYKGFSSRISFRYQDITQRSIDARSDVLDEIGASQYFLDFTMKQKIYKGLSMSFDWTNINNFVEENFVNHSKYPGHSEYYGSTMQLGLRYQF